MLTHTTTNMRPLCFRPVISHRMRVSVRWFMSGCGIGNWIGLRGWEWQSGGDGREGKRKKAGQGAEGRAEQIVDQQTRKCLPEGW